MKLRKLEEKDAPFMLEWMHDDSVVHNLATDFSQKTLDDCKQFIKAATSQLSNLNSLSDLHLAIVDENDEYMGTVSLKHVDRNNSSAEFAITVRKVAMGQGYSQYGMKEIIRLGHQTLSLKQIYWCVDKNNIRAIRFYDKQRYQRIEASKKMLESYGRNAVEKKLMWYCSDKYV